MTRPRRAEQSDIDKLNAEYELAVAELLSAIERMDERVPEPERFKAAIAAYFLRRKGAGNFPLWLLRQPANDPRIQAIGKRYVENNEFHETTQLASLLDAHAWATQENATLQLLSNLAHYDESPRTPG